MPDTHTSPADAAAGPTEAEAAVRAWIQDAFAARNGAPLEALGPDDELIESRIIDSLTLMNLIHFLEELVEREIPMQGIDVDSFRTLRRIGATYLSGGPS